MFNLQKISPGIYLLPKEGEMKVPGLIISSEKLLQSPGIEKPLEQVRNVACLPGIVNYSIAMPDMHWGYGFPIGGVAAMDAKEGVISPGGVGYDINCGVRLAIIPILYDEINEDTKNKLLEELFRSIPSGVGSEQKKGKALSQSDYNQIISNGAAWAIEQGYGFSSDLEHIESNGKIDNADISAVSTIAQNRGKKQLGSLGSGNHFVEIGKIEEILNANIANKWNVTEGITYALIHSGSRGFGHQVCQDFLDRFIKKGYAKGLLDRQLVAAPIQSEDGHDYFQAMASAANFAFNNRQFIMHYLRQTCNEVLGIKPQEVRLVYDVCHNIAKFEEYDVDGKKRKLCVHRKGATRSFGPNSEELAPIFKETGQPVLVPGDMGRASYLLVGKGKPETWSSCCHGAGREKSRKQAMSSWSGKDLISYMKEKGTDVKAASTRTIAEEMPDAYKNVDDVVDSVVEANLAGRVAKLKPHLVIKG